LVDKLEELKGLLGLWWRGWVILQRG
jgi:hypothetical protein